MLYSGHDKDHQRGVEIVMSKEIAKCLEEWEAINKNLITATLNSKYAKLIIVKCYAPTNDATEGILQKNPSRKKRSQSITLALLWEILTPGLETIIILISLRGRWGQMEHVKGMTLGSENLIFSVKNGLVITGTLFHYRDIHKIYLMSWKKWKIRRMSTQCWMNLS